MKAGRLVSVGVACVLLAMLTVAAGATPLHSAALRDFVAGPCAPGTAYDPACDANQDGQITVTDIQLTAGHWNQTGAFTSDNNHNHLGQTWTGSNNPLKIQGAFGAPDYTPLLLSNSTGHGVRVDSAGTHGVSVGSAGYNGVSVGSADNIGVSVGFAGTYGVSVFEAGTHGVSVGSAGYNGVSVFEAGQDGFAVKRAGSASIGLDDLDNNNGFEVGHAEDYGVKVVLADRAAFRSDGSGTNAFYAYDAGDSGVWIRAATNWAGYFAGDINVTGNCTGCRIAQMAVNTGNEALHPGDIVAMDGIAASSFDRVEVLMQVRHATPGSSLLGVVSGRAEPYTSHEDSTTTLVPRTGQAAGPGEFLSVVIYGPVQMKAAPDVQLGQRVTVNDARAVRAMHRVMVEGVTLDEGGSSLGIALDAAKDGLVWVLVNPQ